MSRFSVVLALALGACVIKPMDPVSPGGVIVESEPPPPQAEPVEVRPGFVWISGHWTFRDGGWAWLAGHWERERANASWIAGRWERQSRGWIWIEGQWSAGAMAASTTVQSSEPAPPSAPTDPSAVSMMALGEGHTCTLSVGGQIRCWGENHDGSLGVGLGAGPKSGDGIVSGIDGQVSAIAAGDFQTCALTAKGEVWCWGVNIEGQVGNGSTAPSEQPVQKPIRVAGIDHVASIHLGNKISCAVTDDRKLYCWGNNTVHAISSSSDKQLTKPTQVTGSGRVDLVAVGNYHVCWTSGGRAQCTGNVAAVNKDVAALGNITSMSAGYEHTCAVHDGGKVSCWGATYHGVLGQGDECPRHDGECTSAQRPPRVVPGLEANVVEVAGDTYFSCVRFATGNVSCFGSNQGGSFSDTLPKDPWQKVTALDGWSGDRIYVGGIHLCTTRGGKPRCRGNNSVGAVGPAR